MNSGVIREFEVKHFKVKTVIKFRMNEEFMK